MGLASPEAAAAGIVDIVNENMLGGLRLVSVQQGFDPRDFALVAFGGAGPLHANALGRLTGAWPVIVPPSPGVLCALGDATTSKRSESARTVLRRFADLTGEDLVTILRELADEAGARLADQGVDAADQTTTYQVDVRYHGQGFEIGIAVEPGWLEEPDAALDAAGRRVRHRARAAVLVPARHRPRAGQRPGHGVGTAPGGGRRRPARTATAIRPRRCVDTHPIHVGRLERATRTSTTARSCGPATSSPARRSSPRWTPRPWCCPATRRRCTRPAAC